MRKDMSENSATWVRDGTDPGWFIAENIGSVRNSSSYRPGGWWFIPDWLPDSADFDIGPFRTKAHATQEAEKLALARTGRVE